MRVGALYAILRLETGAFHSALGHAEGRFAAFAGVLKAGGLIALQGLALVTAGSLAMASSFEQHMNQSLAIMGDVSDGMRQKMEDAARAVAKTSTFSANEAADAYYFLASAGFTAEQSVAALPTVTQFAQAGVMDLEKATELLMDSMTTMGMRTDDAAENQLAMARTSDVLTAAQVNSNATLQQMAEALTNKAGPALRTVGKDIEEGAAALMVLANRGVKGQEAGTALAIVLRELQTKAIKNKDAFREMGIAVFDAAGEMRSLPDILHDMEKAFTGLTDEQKKEALLTLGFTDRSVGFVQAVLGSSEEMRKFEAMLREAGGTTQTVAEKQLNTFNNQLTIMWHKIQDVAISIGQKLLPGATDVVRAIGNWIDANHDLIVTIAVGMVDAIAKAIGFIGDIIGWIGQGIDKVKEARGTFQAFGDLVASIFSPNGPQMDGLRKYMEKYDLLDDRLVDISETMLGVLRPAFDEINAVVTPVATAVGNIVTNMDAFGDLIVSVFSPDGEALNGVRQYMDAFEDLDPVVVGVMETIGTKVSETFTYLANEVFPPLQDAIMVLVEDYVLYLGEQWAWITDEVLPKLAELVQVIAEENLPMLGDGLSWLTDDVMPALDEAFRFFIDEVLPSLQDAMMAVLDWVTTNWPLLSKIAGQVFGAIGTLIEVLWNVIAFNVKMIWDGMEPLAKVLFPLLGDAATVLLEVISFVFFTIGVVWQTTADAAKLIGKAIGTAFAWLGDFFGRLWKTIVGEFKNAVNIFVDIINGFLGFLNNIRFGIPKIVLPGLGEVFGGAMIDPFNISFIPHLAAGTDFFKGGLAMVGENGPELAYLPHGAGVLPAGQTADLLGGGAREVHYHRHIEATVNGILKDIEDKEDLVGTLQDLSRLESAG